MKVKFTPQDVEFEIAQGQTVMDLAHKNGIPVRSTCNGMPSCAECRVNVTDGDWNTSPPSRKELSLIGTGYYIDQRRLSCQMLCFGDITVDTSEQIEKCAEGPVTKKFLTKVHKETAAQSHSKGGVLLEDNNELLHEMQKDVPDAPVALTAASLDESRRSGGGGGRDRGGRSGQGRGRDNRGAGGGGGRDRGPGGNRAGGNREARGGRDNQPRASADRGGGGNRDGRGGPDNQQRGGGQFHNPADANIPAHAPHPVHQPGFATPEMQTGAGIGDRGVSGQERGPRPEGGPRGDGSGRRRRRGGRGRNRGGGGGGQGGGGGNSGGAPG